jgi:hypothetical protein
VGSDLYECYIGSGKLDDDKKICRIMAGIVFLSTRDMGSISDFYIERIGMEKWMEQEDCIILKHGNLLLGFCQRDRADTCGIITFFFETEREVDEYYRIFRDCAESPPKLNDKYNIYHFFCRDPEGRRVEFQKFNDRVISPC